MTGGAVQPVAFSPDGRTLAAGNINGAVWLWNVTNPVHPTKIAQTSAGPAEGVLSVAFSRDGHILAVGGADGTIWLWNLTNPAHLSRIGQPLSGPTSGVFSVAFTTDGHTLITASYDNTIRLWNITNPADPSQIGQPLADFGNVYPSRSARTETSWQAAATTSSGCGTSMSTRSPKGSAPPQAIT